MTRLNGKKVFITQGDDYMGPAIKDLFAKEGAEVTALPGLYRLLRGPSRGAQNSFVRTAGLEFAPANVQINAIAQNYVSNPVYYPDELVASTRFQKHLERNVPTRRIARQEEQAELALFLASDKSDFIVGQVMPFAGGWVTTT